MYVRDCLKPGDYLMPVPLGLPITLQYSAGGLLEGIYQGYGHDRTNVTDILLDLFRKHHTSPLSIPIKGGTTWIKGVLYTGTRFYSDGALPSAISSDIISAYSHNPTSFNFFAGNVDSLSASIKGAVPTRNWLSVTGFNVLPGWLISKDITKDEFIQMIDNDKFPFIFPLISDYIIYRGMEVRFVSTQLKQFIVNEVKRYTDQYGYIRAKLIDKFGSERSYVDYSEVVRLNIQKNSLVILDCYGNLIYSVSSDNNSHIVSPNINCTVCGRPFKVPKDGEVICPDINCMSRLYPELNHFLTVLKLPNMDIDTYNECVANGDLTCIPDVLQLPDYIDCRIQVTLSDVLASVVPVSVVSDKSIFSSFVNSCNNNLSSFRYYIQHPDLLVKDVDEKNISYNKFIRWLQTPPNVLNIQAILESPQISIIETNKKFEGSPIFRGKTIMITGDFLHGSHSDISAILKSYSAEVTTQFSEVINCVLIGGTHENIDGISIRNARNLNIPIYEEQPFFEAYEIDADIHEYC